MNRTESGICPTGNHVTKLLPCFHVVRLDALIQASRDSPPECPVCRTPTGKVENLPENFFGKRLEQFNQIASLFETNMAGIDFCQICAPTDNGFREMCAPTGEDEKRRSVVFCFDCRQAMCLGCSECHSRMRLTKSHAVVSVGERFTPSEILGKTRRKCELHETENEKLFCLDCDSPICFRCYSTGAHNTHDVIATFKMAVEGRERISEDLRYIQDMISKGSRFLDEVEREEERFLENVDRITADIEKKRQRTQSEFLSFGFDLNEKLQGHCTGRLSEISAVLDTVERQLVEPGELVDQFKDLVDVVPSSAIPELEADYCRITENSKVMSEFLGAKMEVTSPSKIECFQQMMENNLLVSREQLISRIGNLVVDGGETPKSSSKKQDGKNLMRNIHNNIFSSLDSILT